MLECFQILHGNHGIYGITRLGPSNGPSNGVFEGTMAPFQLSARIHMRQSSKPGPTGPLPLPEKSDPKKYIERNQRDSKSMWHIVAKAPAVTHGMAAPGSRPRSLLDPNSRETKILHIVQNVGNLEPW